MHNYAQSIIKSLSPPLLLNFIKEKFNEVKWYGNYPDWSEANKESYGYEWSQILKAVKESALKVKSGEAVFERDSMLFYEPVYSWPLLSSLLRIAALNNNNLNLIDFGGSLGSTYFQHKKMLSHLSQMSWNIVEQYEFVNCGNLDFKDHILNFFTDIDSCVKAANVNTFLSSCTMQYIPEPFNLINKIKSLNFEYLIFDRTAFITGTQNLLTVQKYKSRSIYYAYPAWFFNLNNFIKLFSDKYKLLITFDSYCDPVRNVQGKRAEWKGLFFEKLKH